MKRIRVRNNKKITAKTVIPVAVRAGLTVPSERNVKQACAFARLIIEEFTTLEERQGQERKKTMTCLGLMR